MSRTHRALALAIALGSFVACRPAPRSDALIASDVKEELRGEETLAADTISVRAVDGVVTLQGVVPSDDSRRRAEEIAGDVSGVKSVANRLEVAARPSAPAPMSPPVSAPPPSEPVAPAPPSDAAPDAP